jgi:maleylacetoacetate isomerase
MPTRPRLFHGLASSASWRVRIALALKELAYDAVLVDLDGGANRGAAYLRTDPIGQVPTLEIDGHRLVQSVAIIEYLDETRPDPPLLPREPHARATARAIVEVVNAGIQPLHNMAVRRRLASQFGASDDGVRAWIGHWVRLRYEGLETILAGIAGRYAVGDALSIADVFLHLQIDKSDEFGVPLAGFPTIDRIYATLSGLPAFADTKLPRP